MKTKITLVFLTLFLVCIKGNTQSTNWTGEKIIFTKGDGTDWKIEENQDRITPNVWITRQDQWSIFNIAQGDISEKTNCFEGLPNYGQPYDTQWAFGTIEDNVDTLIFDDFLGPNFTNCGPGGTGDGVSPVGMNAVLHLITDDIYIDIKFLSWTTGKTEIEPGVFGGGGFSYERSTDQSLSTNEFELNNTLNIYPNPSHDFIQITGLTSAQNFKVHNVLGAEILNGNVEKEGEINIQNLIKGIYVIHFENGTALKFVKN